MSSLVAYYSGSEDEEDVMHDEEAETAETSNGNNNTTSASTLQMAPITANAAPLSKPSMMMSMFMSDDDDDEKIVNTLEDPSSSDNPSNDVNPVWDERLPKPKKVANEEANDDVEIGPIPPKKVYGDEELPPAKPSTYSSLAMGKKVQGKVCISIPFLNSLEDPGAEDSERKKLLKPSQKGSGLFSLLPQPKSYGSSAVFSSKSVTSSTNANLNLTTTPSSNNFTVPTPGPSVNKLIPDSVKNKLKRSASEKTNELRAKYSRTDVGQLAATAKSKHADSDSDDDDGGDFFSFNSVTTVDPIALEKLKLPTPNFEKVQPPPEEMETEQQMEEPVNYAQPSRSDDLMKFIQSRKGKNEDVRIVDINADDLRPDNTEWIKNITDESAQPARRAKGLGGMVKRKHQITYLAFEAKAREQELKNQWAQNRANKMATKNKYGF